MIAAVDDLVNIVNTQLPSAECYPEKLQNFAQNVQFGNLQTSANQNMKT